MSLRNHNDSLRNIQNPTSSPPTPVSLSFGQKEKGKWRSCTQQVPRDRGQGLVGPWPLPRDCWLEILVPTSLSLFRSLEFWQMRMSPLGGYESPLLPLKPIFVCLGLSIQRIRTMTVIHSQKILIIPNWNCIPINNSPSPSSQPWGNHYYVFCLHVFSYYRYLTEVCNRIGPYRDFPGKTAPPPGSLL